MEHESYIFIFHLKHWNVETLKHCVVNHPYLI